MITLANGTHDAGGTLAADAKGHAALLDVGAGNVEFDGGNALQSIDAGGALGVIVW